MMFSISYRLMNDCWEMDPEDRSTFEELEMEIFQILNEISDESSCEVSECDAKEIDSFLNPNELCRNDSRHRYYKGNYVDQGQIL